MRSRSIAALLFPVLTTVVLSQPARPGQQPTRDVTARVQSDATPTTASVAGRVVAADSGRPLRRARVLLSGAAVPGGRGTLTDEDGRFQIAALPAGRFTLTAARAGFVTVAYGQRRPFQAGTPIQLAEGEQLTSVDLHLPRGSVIAGHVFDEAGEPLPGAAVRVMRYEYAQGNRQLVPVGGSQTDDLGAYRVWGLNPGAYYVSATIPNLGPGGRRGRAEVPDDNVEQVGYAPTYYPGSPSVNEARAVNVGLSAEVVSIDFGVLLVRTSRVSGRVSNPDATATTAGRVTLLPEGGGPGGRGGPGLTHASRIDWDGSFRMGGVPPGRYTLRARSDDSVEPLFAVVPLVVSDRDMTDLTVILSAAASISGTAVFQSSQRPDPGQFRIAAPLVDSVAAGPNPAARVERDGRFVLSGVQAGPHLLRAQGIPRGWALKSATVDGRDVLDTPFELRSGQSLAGVQLVFTDRVTEVNGTITDNQGAPVPDYTMIAFPVDDTLWRPLSRHIVTARPDQNGTFQLRGLPPGDYYVVPIDPVEQGEWFEPSFLDAHRSAAARVSVAEGDVKTQDFALAAR